MTRLIAVCAAMALLAGCATRPEWLENRVSCTAAGDRAYVDSMWGPVGIASIIADKDAAALCAPRAAP